MEQSGIRPPRLKNSFSRLRLTGIALGLGAILSFVLVIYNAQEKSAEFLTVNQYGTIADVKTILTKKQDQKNLLANNSGNTANIAFNHEDILSPYKVETVLSPNGEIIALSVNRDASDIGFKASGFQNYKNFTITIDDNLLIADGSYDWAGKFETPIAYYTKPGGFVFCYNAYKENKSDGIAWCHKVPEGRRA